MTPGALAAARAQTEMFVRAAERDAARAAHSAVMAAHALSLLAAHYEASSPQGAGAEGDDDVRGGRLHGAP